MRLDFLNCPISSNTAAKFKIYHIPLYHGFFLDSKQNVKSFKFFFYKSTVVLFVRCRPRSQNTKNHYLKYTGFGF